MMLRKYQVEKIENEDIDDFRRAVIIMAKNTDDATFSKFLTKHAKNNSAKDE